MHQSSNMIVTIPQYILIGSGQVYVLFIDSQITDVCKHTPATRCPQLRGYCAMSGVKQVALLRAFLLIGVVNAVQTWPTTPSPGCIEDTDCEMSQDMCNVDYSNCNYCDEGVCKPGWCLFLQICILRLFNRCQLPRGNDGLHWPTSLRLMWLCLGG